MNHNAVILLLLNICHLFCQIPHIKIGPEETPRLPYLRFASVTLYPSNEDLSLAIGAILRSFSYPSASLVCAKAECEYKLCESSTVCVCVRSTLWLQFHKPVHIWLTASDTEL